MDERRKHGWPFWFAVGVIALVLYVASSGPVIWSITQTRLALWMHDNLSDVQRRGVFTVIGIAYFPLDWAIANSPESIQHGWQRYIQFWVPIE